MTFSTTRRAGHPSAHADILHLGARVHKNSKMCAQSAHFFITISISSTVQSVLLS